MVDAIKIKNLRQGYGKKIVLDDINLNIKQGTIMGLLAPSGAGKTTLIRTIMGMLKPKEGEIEVLGQKMPQRKLLGEIGYMAQADALYGKLSAYENIKFFATLMGVEDNTSIMKSMSIVNLENDLKTKVEDYSGGMQRRLSLAIALVANPEVLVLDEPTVGIDPVLRRQIWSELHKLAKKGTTTLITTHVMEDAQECDNLLLLRNGKQIAQGSPTQLKQQYQADSIEDVFIKSEKLEEKGM